jgi:hypothetical protein
VIGGRGEIRTHDTVSRTPDFESGALNHSATLPHEADQAKANLAYLIWKSKNAHQKGLREALNEFEKTF